MRTSIVLSPACDYLATRESIWSTATATLHHKLDGLESVGDVGSILGNLQGGEEFESLVLDLRLRSRDDSLSRRLANRW